MKSFPFLAFGLMLVSFLAAEPAEASCRSREVDVKVGQMKRSARTPDLLRLNLGYSTNEHCLMEVTWHHFLNQYVGLGGGVSCGVGFLGKNMPNGYITDSDYDQWRMISGEEDEWNIDAAAPKFLFSGIFKTPDLLDFGRCKVACLVEPGAVLAIPFSRRQVLLSNDAGDTKTEYVRGWGGRSVFWQCRGTLMLSFDDFGIGLNYSLNDIDLYSSVRTLSYNGTEFHDFYPKEKKLYHTFGLTLSYSF
ncbi:MAG TPA: hypothetical protein DDX40_08085 [Rikenellaceae bacterium]|nr:hypothetical protein [Rikenellaceae bacterium]